MDYPKPLMSISDLVKEMGFSRAMLKQYSRCKDFPAIRTIGRGKIYVKTAELDKFFRSRE